MLLRWLRTVPSSIPAIALLGGIAIMLLAIRPLAYVGGILVMFAMHMPFIQLPDKRGGAKPATHQPVSEDFLPAEPRESPRSGARSTARTRRTEAPGGG